MRQLFVPAGYSSLYTYCREALGYTEDAAYNRKVAARVARRYPAILDMLADGRLGLTTVRLLAPVLRDSNCDAAFKQAAGASKREVEKLVARLSPRPDVPPTVRKLPARAAVAAAEAAPDSATDEEPPESGPGATRETPAARGADEGNGRRRRSRTAPRTGCGARPSAGGTAGDQGGTGVAAGETAGREAAGAWALSRPVHDRRGNREEAAPSPDVAEARDPGRRSRRALRPGAGSPPGRRRGKEAGENEGARGGAAKGEAALFCRGGGGGGGRQAAEAGLTSRSGADASRGLAPRRGAVRLRRVGRAAVHRARVPRVPPRADPIRPRRSADAGQHRPVLPDAQRVRGEAGIGDYLPREVREARVLYDAMRLAVPERR